jgi:hypothetical protein
LTSAGAVDGAHRSSRLADTQAHFISMTNVPGFQVHPAHCRLRLIHRRLKGILLSDRLLTVASCPSQFLLRLTPLFTVLGVELSEFAGSVLFLLDGGVSASLQAATDLGHFIMGVKAVITLLGLREDLMDPSGNALGGILDDDLQSQSLGLALA